MSNSQKYSIKKLEYNVTHHCNLKCDFCDHLSPYFSNQDSPFAASISLDTFREHLNILSRHLHSEEFLILGGEPLLNKDAWEFIRAVKESKITDQTVLVTNGFLLSTQKEELFHFVDKICITVYPSAPLKQELIEKIRERCAAESVELEINTKPKFMISILGAKNEDSRLVSDIFNTCSVAWKNRCFALHDGYLYRCSRAPFIAYKLVKAGVVAEDFSKKDALKVEDSSDFQDKIKAYFSSEVPLQSCAYCLGSVGKQIKHRQLSQAEIQRESWVEYRAEDSIDHMKLFKKKALLRLFNQR